MPNAQCPFAQLPNAQMPNTQCPMPDPKSPILNVQCPIAQLPNCPNAQIAHCQPAPGEDALRQGLQPQPPEGGVGRGGPGQRAPEAAQLLARHRLRQRGEDASKLVSPSTKLHIYYLPH